MTETQRQRKIGNLLQKEIVDLLQSAATTSGLNGVLISVTKVSVTQDLANAKVYLSIFPSKSVAHLLEGIKSNTPLIRHELAQRTRNQLRRMPQLSFFIDDSLDYIENIERSLENSANPIENTELLSKRKKS